MEINAKSKKHLNQENVKNTLDTIKFIDCSGDPKFYSQIPNIIFELGLTTIEIALYCFIKRISAHSGVCFMSSINLCEKLVIAPGTLRKSKKILEEKKLISIEKKSKKEGGYHIITILNIWNLNNSYFSKKEYAVSKCAPGVGQNVPTNKKEYINIYKEKEQKKDTVTEVTLASDDAHSLFNEFEKGINRNRHEKNLKPIKVNNSKTQLTTLDKLIQRAGKEKTLEIIKFALEDQFWQQNILTPVSLNKHFIKLEMQNACKQMDVAKKEERNDPRIEIAFRIYNNFMKEICRDPVLFNKGELEMKEKSFCDKKTRTIYKKTYDELYRLLKERYEMPFHILNKIRFECRLTAENSKILKNMIFDKASEKKLI
jgi:hypothetical protein